MTNSPYLVAAQALYDGHSPAWTALAEELDRQRIADETTGYQVQSCLNAAQMMEVFTSTHGTAGEPITDIRHAISCLLHAAAMLSGGGDDYGESEGLFVGRYATKAFVDELAELR